MRNSETSNLNILLKTSLQMKSLFDEAVQQFGETVSLYSSLVNCYAILRMETEAEQVFTYAEKNNWTIEAPMFTSMIKAYYRAGNINAVWDLYEKRYIYLANEDDMLMNTMINICAATHEAENAKQIWDRMTKKGAFIIFLFGLFID
jgi:pentatricopeptide repeat protein